VTESTSVTGFFVMIALPNSSLGQLLSQVRLSPCAAGHLPRAAHKARADRVVLGLADLVEAYGVRLEVQDRVLHRTRDRVGRPSGLARIGDLAAACVELEEPIRRRLGSCKARDQRNERRRRKVSRKPGDHFKSFRRDRF
jgi:hypothetical protein